MTVLFVVILANNQSRWFLLPYMKKPQPMRARPGWKVAVVTTFVPGAESLEMLEGTVKALVSMDYPHDTWILDEGNDEKVVALSLKIGAKHFSRKNFSQYQTSAGVYQMRSKHGNYNAWLSQIGFEDYDIVTIFDPDHVPDRTFLSRVLGYFEDPEVAYVQVAQAYYNQQASFVARGAAEETYAYYSFVQMASYGLGYSVIVGGHNTHRLSALKESGLPARDPEDLMLTLSYQASGWRGVYVPEILARGLAPVDWSGYLSQQRRWARNLLDLKFRVQPGLFNTLTWKSWTMGALHGLGYLHRTAIIFLVVILTGFMLATGSTPNVISYLTIEKLACLVLVLQVCELYRQSFYLDVKNEWGLHWRAGLLQYAKWPWFLLALFEVLCGKEKPYVVTNKVKSESKNRLLLRSNLFTIVFLCSTWGIGQEFCRPMCIRSFTLSLQCSWVHQ